MGCLPPLLLFLLLPTVAVGLKTISRYQEQQLQHRLKRQQNGQSSYSVAETTTAVCRASSQEWEARTKKVHRVLAIVLMITGQ